MSFLDGAKDARADRQVLAEGRQRPTTPIGRCGTASSQRMRPLLLRAAPTDCPRSKRRSMARRAGRLAHADPAQHRRAARPLLRVGPDQGAAVHRRRDRRQRRPADPRHRLCQIPPPDRQHRRPPGRLGVRDAAAWAPFPGDRRVRPASTGSRSSTDAEVAEIDITERPGDAASACSMAAGSRPIVVLSNADPHRTFPGMVGEQHLPADFVDGVRRIKVKGSVVKVLMGLGELPNFTAYAGHRGRSAAHRRHRDQPVDRLSGRRLGRLQARSPVRRPFMDCYIQTATEDGLAPPGKHTLSLFVQYAPYDLAEGTWDERRDEIGNNIVDTFAEYAPNMPACDRAHARCSARRTSSGSSASPAATSSTARSCPTRCSATAPFPATRLPDAGRGPLSLRLRRLAGRRGLRRARPQLRPPGAGGPLVRLAEVVRTSLQTTASSFGLQDLCVSSEPGFA